MGASPYITRPGAVHRAPSIVCVSSARSREGEREGTWTVRGASRHPTIRALVSGAWPSPCACAVTGEGAGGVTVRQRYASEGARCPGRATHIRGERAGRTGIRMRMHKCSGCIRVVIEKKAGAEVYVRPSARAGYGSRSRARKGKTCAESAAQRAACRFQPQSADGTSRASLGAIDGYA